MPELNFQGCQSTFHLLIKAFHSPSSNTLHHPPTRFTSIFKHTSTLCGIDRWPAMNNKRGITDLVESGSPNLSKMGNQDGSSTSKPVVGSLDSMVRVLW